MLRVLSVCRSLLEHTSVEIVYGGRARRSVPPALSVSAESKRTGVREVVLQRALQPARARDQPNDRPSDRVSHKEPYIPVCSGRWPRRRGPTRSTSESR